MKTPIEKLIDAADSVEEDLQHEVESAEDEVYSLLKSYDVPPHGDRPYHTALHKVMEPIVKFRDLVGDVQAELSSMQDYVVKAEEQVASLEQKIEDYDAMKTIFKDLSTKGKRAMVRLLMSEGVFEMYDESFISEFLSFDETENEVKLLTDKAGAMK